jgi:hypothetical protein
LQVCRSKSNFIGQFGTAVDDGHDVFQIMAHAEVVFSAPLKASGLVARKWEAGMSRISYSPILVRCAFSSAGRYQRLLNGDANRRRQFYDCVYVRGCANGGGPRIRDQ